MAPIEPVDNHACALTSGQAEAEPSVKAAGDTRDNVPRLDTPTLPTTALSAPSTPSRAQLKNIVNLNPPLSSSCEKQMLSPRGATEPLTHIPSHGGPDVVHTHAQFHEDDSVYDRI